MFEVTGPIIFLVVFNYTTTNDGATLSSQDIVLCTQLINIMDINPNNNWSVDTFLQHVDAIISPASGVRTGGRDFISRRAKMI